jgi:hypothetical protein
MILTVLAVGSLSTTEDGILPAIKVRGGAWASPSEVRRSRAENTS